MYADPSEIVFVADDAASAVDSTSSRHPSTNRILSVVNTHSQRIVKTKFQHRSCADSRKNHVD